VALCCGSALGGAANVRQFTELCDNFSLLSPDCVNVAGGNGTTSVTINVGPNTSPGFYPVVVLGDGGSLKGTAMVALTVTP